MSEVSRSRGCSGPKVERLYGDKESGAAGANQFSNTVSLHFLIFSFQGWLVT